MNRFINAMFSCAICAVAVASSGCNKDDDMTINQENIIGEWEETYEKYPYFMQDGFLKWNFKADNNVDVHVYDIFAGDSYVTRSYYIEKNVIHLDAELSDKNSGRDYNITKLTKDEMEWQMVGTSFAKGTVGSDFRHFKRKK